MDQDTVATLLLVVTILGVIFLATYAAIGIFFAYIIVKARRRIKRIERWVNSAPTYKTVDILKPRENLTTSEVNDIKAFIRDKKAREARDLDTIDKATEYRRDFQ